MQRRLIENCVVCVCVVWCYASLSERQCQNWFARFRSGNFDVEDEPGRPIVENVDKIL